MAFAMDDWIDPERAGALAKCKPDALVHFIANGAVRATGFRLVDGACALPLQREEVTAVEGKGASLTYGMPGIASSRPSGWILRRDGANTWAAIRLNADDLAAACAPKPAEPRGRKDSYNWRPVEREAFRLLDDNGDFMLNDTAWTKAELDRRLSDFMLQQFSVSPSASLMKKRRKQFHEEWLRAKATN